MKKYIVLVLQESFDEFVKVVDVEAFDNKELAKVSYQLHVNKFKEKFSEVYKDYEVQDTSDGKAISNSDGTEILHVKFLESEHFDSTTEVPEWLKEAVSPK